MTSSIHIGTVYIERIPRGVLLTFFSIAEVNKYMSGHSDIILGQISSSSLEHTTLSEKEPTHFIFTIIGKLSRYSISEVLESA